MQEEILKIQLILENCETITIDGKYIGDFEINNIRTDISRMGCNYIGENTICDVFLISIYRDANIEESTQWTMGETNKKRKVFDRILAYKDITSVIIYWANGKEQSICVPWRNGKSEDENLYQDVRMSSKGDLYIVVDRNNRTINDIWTNDEIEDDYDFAWIMYECKQDEEEEV